MAGITRSATRRVGWEGAVAAVGSPACETSVASVGLHAVSSSERRRAKRVGRMSIGTTFAQ